MLQLSEEGLPPFRAKSPERVCIVALVGFMGAGKTTVGRALSDRLGWSFTDLDHVIEKRERQTIPQIFALHGEAHFRALEFEVLQQILDESGSQPLILALGGGAFTNPVIREMLHRNCVPSVWLDAPVDELFQRCDQPGVPRPLRRDAQQFAKLHEQRLSSYRQADLHVVTNGKEISSIVEEVIAGLALNPAPGNQSEI